MGACFIDAFREQGGIRVSVETAMSARQQDTGRGQRRPADKVRALQWTLFRCAKQEPERRFHAL